MIEQHEQDAGFRGCVINISSASGVMVSTNRGDYCMAAAANSMATKLWAVRLAPHGIDVYEIRPGIIETDMTAPVKEKYDKLIAEGLSLQPRWGTPADVGRAAAALCRGDIPYATGQVLAIDGGITIQRL
jgi:NAD(P)-dependent dehydrogenase (short-subunit alcohol dehydrogenase family)